eukprot:7412700-Alexandrium_andersonii.AAC.1
MSASLVGSEMCIRDSPLVSYSVPTQLTCGTCCGFARRTALWEPRELGTLWRPWLTIVRPSHLLCTTPVSRHCPHEVWDEQRCVSPESCRYTCVVGDPSEQY